MSLPLQTLCEALGLKALPRAGWVQRGVPQPESVAAHSWGVAWLVLTLLPPELSRERALTYAVLHDLPEVRVGDLTPADGVPAHDKAAREAAAMQAMCARQPHLIAAWSAYEAQGDPEARFVRELDRLDMALQALVYAQAGHPGMGDFVASAGRVVAHPALRPILDDIAAHIALLERGEDPGEQDGGVGQGHP